MKKYRIEIEGVNTMIQNKLDRDYNKEIKQQPKDKLEEFEEQNYLRKLYKNQEGDVIMPSINIHAMITNACKKYKISPPKSIGRTWTGYSKSSIIIENDAILSYDKIIPFGTTVNGNPSAAKGSSKVYRVRPMLLNWKTNFILTDLEDYLKKDDIHGIIDTAGKFVGMSDWRPQHGRFIIKSIKEVA